MTTVATTQTSQTTTYGFCTPPQFIVQTKFSASKVM